MPSLIVMLSTTLIDKVVLMADLYNSPELKAMYGDAKEYIVPLIGAEVRNQKLAVGTLGTGKTAE